MSASNIFSLFSRFSPFFPTQEDLQKFYDSPLVFSLFCLSLPSAGRHGYSFHFREAPRGMEPHFIFAILPIALAMILNTLGVEQKTINRVQAAVIFDAALILVFWTFFEISDNTGMKRDVN